MEQGATVRGIAYDKNVGRISILGVNDEPGVLAAVFNALAAEQIDVDIIVQSGTADGHADFSFTVGLDDIEKAIAVVESLKAQIGHKAVTSEKNLVKISIVGAGMVSTPGVAAKMFDTIYKQGVSIKMVSTSEIKISCVVELDKLTEVVLALHTAYGLDAATAAFVGGPKDRR